MESCSNISNIFRGLDNYSSVSKEIKNNKLLILKYNNNIQTVVEIKYKEQVLYNDTKLKISLNDFLVESTKNFFIKFDKKIIAFTDKEFLTQFEYNQKIFKNNKKENILPISYYDFYCKLHRIKYTYFCLDCNTHLCDKCKLIFFNHKKTIKYALKNIFSLAVESNIKILNTDNKSLKNIIYKNLEINNKELLNKDKKQKHKHDNLVYIDDYKLSDEELKYYENKIEQFEKKLENSKSVDINCYENNILLLKYCKIYIDFYRKNRNIGLNYIIIDIIKNNIKFNEKFLNQSDEQNKKELILNLPVENVDKSVFFMKQIHKISYPILDVLNTHRNWDFETIISIFVSFDKSKFIVTLSTGIIKIYNISNFEILYSIKFIDEYNKLNNNNNNFNINKDFFYAKMTSNGNVIVTNCEKRVYLIKIAKKGYIIEKKFENYNDDITFFTEITKNRHYVTGGKKINIYNYYYQKIISIRPIIDINDFVGEPMARNIVYLPNKNLLISLFLKYGPQSSRSSGITIINTKNSLYKIIWGLGGVYPVNETPYSIAINKNNLVIFSYEMYNLYNGDSFIVNYDNAWTDCDCGVFFGESWILKEKFKNNIYQFTKDFIMNYKIKTIENRFYNGQKTGLIKITDEIICYFDGSDIIFLKY